MDGDPAADLNRLQTFLVQPFNVPNAESAIFADGGQLVAHDVAKLDQPNLVFVCLEISYASLRDHIRWTVVVGEQTELIYVHVVVSTLLQLEG